MNLFKSLRIFVYYRLAVWQRYLGMMWHDRSTLHDSQALFSRALGLDNQHPKARLERGILRWRELDDWQGAIEDFSVVLARIPDHLDGLLCRSMAYCRGGDYLMAIDDLERLLHYAPDSRQAHSARVQLQSLYRIASELPTVQKRLDALNIPLLLDGMEADSPDERTSSD